MNKIGKEKSSLTKSYKSGNMVKMMLFHISVYVCMYVCNLLIVGWYTIVAVHVLVFHFAINIYV